MRVVTLRNRLFVRREGAPASAVSAPFSRSVGLAGLSRDSPLSSEWVPVCTRASLIPCLWGTVRAPVCKHGMLSCVPLIATLTELRRLVPCCVLSMIMWPSIWLPPPKRACCSLAPLVCSDRFGRAHGIEEPKAFLQDGALPGHASQRCSLARAAAAQAGCRSSSRATRADAIPPWFPVLG